MRQRLWIIPDAKCSQRIDKRSSCLQIGDPVGHWPGLVQGILGNSVGGRLTRLTLWFGETLMETIREYRGLQDGPAGLAIE